MNLRTLLCLLPAGLLWNCGPTPKLSPNFHKPQVVLVLPPENTTGATQVEEMLYPIVYEKMANRGYYCLAPELVRGIFNANKLEDAGRINSLAPGKFLEIFGADAILRVRVLDWSSKYIVISSSVTVKLEMTLVDTKTGEELWSLTHVVSKAPGGGGNSLIGALVSTALHAAFTPYEPIAEENAKVMIQTVPQGDYGKGSRPASEQSSKAGY